MDQNESFEHFWNLESWKVHSFSSHPSLIILGASFLILPSIICLAELGDSLRIVSFPDRRVATNDTEECEQLPQRMRLAFFSAARSLLARGVGVLSDVLFEIRQDSPGHKPDESNRHQDGVVAKDGIRTSAACIICRVGLVRKHLTEFPS